MKQRRLQFRDRFIFTCNIFFSVNYLLWRLFFTIPHGYGLISEIAGWSLLAVEALGLAEAVIHYYSMYHANGYPLPNAQAWEYPDVDVFVVTYNEEPNLVYKTINGCCHMVYPNKEKVHIYLCDDGQRDSMREIAEHFGVNYLSREDRTGAKAGNLNHALKNSSSAYIVTFDADMIPGSLFLMKTMPYFIDAQRKNNALPAEARIELGFVQSPQSFYNPDVFQFNLYSEERIPNEQDYFYRDIQVARTFSNSVIYGGSNTVLSRAALEKVGGFYTDSITEDFATGILIQKEGYVSLAIDEPLANGLSVSDMPSLIRQRSRWARGVIQSGRKLRILLSSKLSFKQKLNYWASIWYWYAPIKRLVYIMSPILYAAFGIMVIRCTLWEVLAFWLPMFLSSNIALRLLSQNIRNTKWTGVYETALFPFLLLPVLLETIGVSMKTFHVSDKSATIGSSKKDIVYMLPFAMLLSLSVFGIARCIMEMFETNSIQPIVVLFWLVGNMYYLTMAMFFVDGREIRRKEHRLKVYGQLQAYVGEKPYKGSVVNISESGIAVSFPCPIYLPPSTEIRIRIENEANTAEVFGRIIYVHQKKASWVYSMQIQDYGSSKDAYLQIVFDRAPGLPQELKGANGSVDDLIINGAGRVRPVFFEKRKLPRVAMNPKVKCPQSISGFLSVYDCNYQYFRVGAGRYLPEKIEITFSNGIMLKGEKVQWRKDVYKILDPIQSDIESVIEEFYIKNAPV